MWGSASCVAQETRRRVNKSVWMIPSPRLAAFLFASGALLAASDKWQALLPASLAALSLLVVLVTADWRRLSKVRLEAARFCDDKLSLGEPNVVRINLRNGGYSRVVGVVRDEHPECSTADGNVLRFDLPPRSEREFTYRVTPWRRGQYQFGDTFVRVQGHLGLLARQIRYSASKAVKAYPSLLDMRRYELALRRDRVLPAGHRTARTRGIGTEFESLREYAPDDEFRAIDWKATARRGKLIVRQYQEERSQNIVVLLDCGRMMGSVVRELTRLDHGINAAVMLAYAASLKGDKVGFMAFDDSILVFIPPKSGKPQVIKLLGAAYDLQDAAGDSDYALAESYLAHRCRRRSMIVILTDIADPESSAPLITQIARISRKHVCVCACLSDPALLDAANKIPESADDVYRAAAAREVVQARKAAAAALAAAGAVVLDVPPARLTPAVVNAYLDTKTRAVL